MGSETHQRILLRMGTVHIRFDELPPYWATLITRFYHPFITAASHRGATTVHLATLDKLTTAALTVTRSAGHWCITRGDFRSCSNLRLQRTTARVELNRYSFDSWLRVLYTLLALQHHTLLIHAAGIRYQNKGFVFPGRSGQGKSTLTRILGRKKALSDELTAVYCTSHAVMAASTPFWGELKRGNQPPAEAPLAALCFLQQGTRAGLQPLPRQDAVKALLKTVLFFSNEPDHLNQLFTLVLAVTARVPTYTLTFARHSSRRALEKLFAALPELEDT